MMIWRTPFARHALLPLGISVCLLLTAQAALAAPGSRLLWASRYDGPAHSEDYATAMGVSPDGSTVFVTGSGAESDGSGDYATVAYDAATGAKEWAERYDGPAQGDAADALVVSPDGRTVFVTGGSIGANGSEDYATVAYDAATGAKVWVKRYDGWAHGDDGASALGVSPDGSTVFATGSSVGSNRSEDYATVAYDAATGTQAWVKRYDGWAHGDDYASALRVSPDGSTVFATGGSIGSNGSRDYATVAYDAAAGTQVWVKRYDSWAHGDDSAIALGVSPDGSTVFVTGGSYKSDFSADYATVAYDAATGNQAWAKRYDGPAHGDDSASALGVSPDGSTVFVTGYSVGSNGYADYATVAYDVATGTKVWVKRYGGHRADVAFALGVSPDGSMVFVTGGSYGMNGSDDATVAYGTT
jgi:hypothetical protein